MDSRLGVRGLVTVISICSDGANADVPVMAPPAVVGIPPMVIPTAISLCPGLVRSFGINSFTFPQAMTLKKAFLKFSDRKAYKIGLTQEFMYARTCAIIWITRCKLSMSHQLNALSKRTTWIGHQQPAKTRTTTTTNRVTRFCHDHSKFFKRSLEGSRRRKLKMM